MKKLISIVIPAYNEEEVLDELERRISSIIDCNSNYEFEVIIVDNGSVDSSFDKLIEINKNNSKYKIVRLSRNFGLDGGISAGLKYAKGDAAVIMNADLQDPPEMITGFIKKWEEGYEIIYGVIKKREGVPLTRKILSSFAYMIIYNLTYKSIPRDVSDFRLIDKKVLNVVNAMEERNKYLRGMITWTGFKQFGIPYERPSRFAGEPKFNFFGAFRIATNGIFSFSYIPLHIATIVGFITSAISFIMILVQLGLFIKYGQIVPGYTSTLIVILGLFGILFFLLGIIGVYISRIYDEVKQRPNFIVKELIGLSDA